jgi:predicted exporter
MKKRILPFRRLLWFALHLGVVLALVLSVVLGFSPPALDTDLLGLLPQSSGTGGSSPEAQRGFVEADRILGERTARNFVILAESEDFDQARKAAEELRNALAEKPEMFEELSFSFDENTVSGGITDFSAFLHEYRYMLLDRQSVDLLKTGKAKEIADEALAYAYGAFSFTNLDTIDSDPFLLTRREQQHFLNYALVLGSSMALRDGVLSAEFEGKHYVLLRGVLTKAGASISRGSGVREIYRSTGELKRTPAFSGASQPPVNFIFSGFPFHSYESSSKAQGEITVISTVTVLVLLLLFLRIFRLPLLVLLILFTALSSIVLGLGAVFLVFRTIHILTFVFGASLIGFCVDYSIHYIIRRGRELNGKDSALWRSLSLSFASSLICFLIFLFAPFGILRQFALFSAAGLLSSFATVFCLFPGKKSAPLLPAGKFYLCPPAWRSGLILLIVLVSLGGIFTGRRTLGIKNDIRSLYTVPQKLLASERIASSVLNYSSSASYFIISGSSLQETLEHEEIFLALLNRRTAGTFLGASLFVPSIKTQEDSYRAAAKLLPLAETQYESLGFSPRRALALREDYSALAGHYVKLDAESKTVDVQPPDAEGIPAAVRQILSGLLIGQSGERWYSAIMPMNSPDNPESASSEAFSALAAEYAWAVFVNKTGDISAELDTLTVTMFKLLTAAYFIIMLGVFVYYRNIITTLKIAAAPVFMILVSLGLHGFLGLPFSFFTASGLILTLGLGLDYMFYFTEDVAPGKNKADDAGTEQAVLLSYVTTALSFGALLFSSFAPVFLLALAVFPALSAAFLWALLMR